MKLVLSHQSMDKQEKESSLMSRMRRASGLSLTAAQPQGLTFAEIKERVMEFMLANERISGIMAYGEGLDKYGATENTRHYDPVEEFNKENSNTVEIMMLVKHDMNFREAELLQEAQKHKTSYNMLLFGAAIKLANKEPMSDALREFVINHLVGQIPEFPKRKPGRPPSDPLVDERKYFAVLFAVKHGLRPSRNEIYTKPSACDVVEAAALELSKTGYTLFALGYGHDNLKKIYFRIRKERKAGGG